MITKNYYANEMNQVRRSQAPWQDLGYSLDIPWNQVYSTGWQFGGNRWGEQEKVLITRPDPEFYAPDNIIRSNVIPEINPSNPIYQFDRSKYTYRL